MQYKVPGVSGGLLRHQPWPLQRSDAACCACQLVSCIFLPRYKLCRRPRLSLPATQPRLGCRQLVASASATTSGEPSGETPPGQGPQPRPADAARSAATAGRGALRRVRATLATLLNSPRVLRTLYIGQFMASMAFVVLYVWGTYVPPAQFSARFNADLALCCLFAAEYVWRLSREEHKLRALLSPWNLCDLLAFTPPLLELGVALAGKRFSLPVDVRWLKILRGVRVMRIGLLASEYKVIRLTGSGGALLTSAANVRVVQLVASVVMLLFSTATLVHAVERIPLHEALYFVTTTLTTVGYGDVVVRSLLGRFIVVALIAVGVVFIPVQASQLYSQLTARNVRLGPLPDARTPMVLVATQLTEIRGFIDYYSEFFAALPDSRLPKRLRMVVLSNKPSYEFQAMQELHERRLTLMEGSALRESDLVTVGAHRALGVLLIGDRFSANPVEEDRSLLFKVWALKSYTKCVPLYVQVLRRASVDKLSPFLDADRDVIVSLEQTRFRLLALSCLCPGASTLLGNLLRTANVSQAAARQPLLAGRRWLRAYVNGCTWQLFEARVGLGVAGVEFTAAVEWIYRSSGCVLIGLLDQGKVSLNPGSRRLAQGDVAVVVAASLAAARAALMRRYSSPGHECMAEVLADRVRTQVFHSAECDYFSRPEPPPTDPECDAAPFMGDWESESMDTEDDVCVWKEVAMGAADGGVGAGAQMDDRLFAVAAKQLQQQQQQQQRRRRQLQQQQQDQSGSAAPTAASHHATAHVSRGSPSATAATAAAAPPAEQGAAAGPVLRDTADAAAQPGPATAAAVEGGGDVRELQGHVIICGSEASFLLFAEQLRRSCDCALPIVVLHPTRPASCWRRLLDFGPVYYVQGTPSEATSLRAANASTARALVFLTHPHRPDMRPDAQPSSGGAQAPAPSLSAAADAYALAAGGERRSRATVLADADALLTVYGVGEEGGMERLHSVVELTFTSSVRFLQPGLLLKGVAAAEGDVVSPRGVGRAPRKGWTMRKQREAAAVAEGLAEWQANPYYCAGRVTVPALMDTFGVQNFLHAGLLADLLEDMCGDDGRPGGAMLRQIQLPEGMEGRTYGELVTRLALGRALVPLGLFRRKPDNPAWRLRYVVTNPAAEEVLEATDRIFVLRERSSVWASGEDWDSAGMLGGAAGERAGVMAASSSGGTIIDTLDEW